MFNHQFGKFATELSQQRKLGYRPVYPITYSLNQLVLMVLIKVRIKSHLKLSGTSAAYSTNKDMGVSAHGSHADKLGCTVVS